MVGNGGIAEKTSAFASTLMPLPESMDFKDGAAFPLNYGTTYYALKQRGELKKGETLLSNWSWRRSGYNRYRNW